MPAGAIMPPTAAATGSRAVEYRRKFFPLVTQPNAAHVRAHLDQLTRTYRSTLVSPRRSHYFGAFSTEMATASV
jgi:hypothetical protein